MKKLVAIFLTLAFAQSCQRSSPPAQTETTTHLLRKHTLVTKNYEVTITVNDPEGTVVSHDVDYYGVSKISGAVLRLKGSTWHTYSADGTPSRFLGYMFQDGDVSYDVWVEGRLMVVKGKSEVLVDEPGTWRY